MITRELGRVPVSGLRPKALIVPHAGYIYSATTAACAYALLKGCSFLRVVLVGPAHRVAFHGVAPSSSSAFCTPFGDVPLSTDGQALAGCFDCVTINEAAHAQEHSLEVQLPFLQLVLGDFELLPLCVGMVDASELAAVLESLYADEGTLFVISSDLSHYHPYTQARAMDQATLKQVLAGQMVGHEQACGATGINALSLLAGSHGLKAQLLDYRNSGDTAGDRDRVVGYGALAYVAGGCDGA